MKNELTIHYTQSYSNMRNFNLIAYGDRDVCYMSQNQQLLISYYCSLFITKHMELIHVITILNTFAYIIIRLLLCYENK